MEKFLNLVRSNNMVQAVLCIAFGLFLMIYPSITVQGIKMCIRDSCRRAWRHCRRTLTMTHLLCGCRLAAFRRSCA